MGPKAILLTALSSLLTSALANTNKDDVKGIFNSVSDDQWKTGLINVDEYRDDMFYWVFKARQNPEQAPLVLWLTGGPGCSSEIALLYENGPYRFNSRGTWCTRLFVQQTVEKVSKDTFTGGTRTRFGRIKLQK